MINYLFCPKCNNNLIKEKYSYWYSCNNCKDIEVCLSFNGNIITDYCLWFDFNSTTYCYKISINKFGLYNYDLYNVPDSKSILNAEIDINNINNLYDLSIKYINNLVFL
jgi:hypothetical protein